MSVDAKLCYDDLTKRPVALEDDPVPELSAEHDVFKDYVLKYCVRPFIPTFALMGTYGGGFNIGTRIDVTGNFAKIAATVVYNFRKVKLLFARIALLQGRFERYTD